METESKTIEKTPTNPIEEKIITNPDQDFNPLMQEAVIERSYTGPNVNITDIPEEIPEPSFMPPPEDLYETENNELADEATSFNPEYNELSDKEKKQGAEMMADAILDGYSTLSGLGCKLATISETKLNKQFAEGLIDPSIRLPADESGNTVSIKEFVESYNEAASEAFEVSEEFKQTVKPPLVRVLQKRGAALTDEQFLMYHFGKDLVSKGIAAFALKKQNNQILQMLQEQTEVIKKESAIKMEMSRQAFNSAEKHLKEELETSIQHEVDNVKKDKKVPVVKIETEGFDTETPTTGGFSQSYVAPPGTPQFGDEAILKHMEEASKIGTATTTKNNSRKRNTGTKK